jgi:PAS domain S-box-containing protein
MPAAIAIFDGGMRYRAISRRYLSDLAWLFSTEVLPPDKVIGRTIYEVSPDAPLRWRDVHARVLAGEELGQEEDFVLRKDGRAAWVRWSMRPWRNVHGRIGGALLISELITEQVKIRHALADSEARFRATFENAAVGITHVAPDGSLLRFNKALSRLLGWPADELITKSVQEVTHPDDRAAELAQFKQLADGRVDSYSMEKRDLRKDGTIVWVRLTRSCVRKSDGSVDYFVAVVEDISARKNAEEALRRQADLLDQSHDAILTWRIGDGIAYWSRGAEVLYGYPREEAIGRSSHELLRTRSSNSIEEIEAQIAREGSWYGELTHATRDGREIVVESRHVRVSYDGEIYVLETNRDITARKHAEEQVHLLMREANHRVKNLLSLVQAIARQTAAGNVEGFIGRFTERIQALAANQDPLGRDERHGADLEDLVRAHLAHFADLVGSRITVHGSKLHLNATAAQAIGLALHELATNAGKYGALSTDPGRVDLGWRLDGDALTMSWTERDGPPVRPPERRGFGTTVIDAMARQALGGEVQLDYARSGLEWHLTCPRGNALGA